MEHVGFNALPSHFPIGQEGSSAMNHQPAARDQPQDPGETMGERQKERDHHHQWESPHVQPGGEETTSPGKMAG
jgi:hypothetical protein